MPIKRLIFDLDNTLIDWKEEYWNAVREAFIEMNLQYNDDTLKKVKRAVDLYEDGIQMTYNKQLMQETIENELGYKLPEGFIDVWLKYLGKCVPERINETEIATLEYLKSKYDLVILSNWFATSQIERLKNAGLYKFFSNTYMPEDFPMKPNKEAFEMAKGEYNKSECIMIGDNFEVDIKGAIEASMKTIYVNKNNKKNEINNDIIVTINNISELKQVL